VLHADVAAVIEKRLIVLIIVVQVILAAEQRFDNLRVGSSSTGLFQFFHVGVAAQPAGQIAGRQRIAFVGGHDSDVILRGAVLAARLRLNAHEFQLRSIQFPVKRALIRRRVPSSPATPAKREHHKRGCA